MNGSTKKLSTIISQNSDMKMLKIVFALTVTIPSFFVSGCCGESKVKTEEAKQREVFLKNKIKKITEYETSVLLGVKQEEKITEVQFLNAKGLPNKKTSFRNGGPDLSISYRYDTNDNLTLENGVNNDNSLAFKETTSYDPYNNPIEHYHYLADGTFKYKSISAYDTKHRRTELAWYWPTGFRSKNVYTYDGAKKITDTEYLEDHTKTYEWKYKYDSQNNLTEAVQYYPDDTVVFKIIYEYNPQSLLIKQTNFQGNTLSDSITFSYDSRNLPISKTEFTASGKISSVCRYSYE
jgi:hypothetical protein